jgi:uncharacterized protein (DUF1501 family)
MGYGVVGFNPNGAAVAGITSSGTGGLFTADTAGTALSTVGRVVIGGGRSGRIKVLAGASSAARSVAGVTASSLAIATLAANRSGVYVSAAVTSTGKVTVHLNKVVSSAIWVTYLILK